MTISREHRDGPYVVQCNTCTDTEELHGETPQDASADAKERGYVAYRIGERKYIHNCGYCERQQAAA